MMLFLWKRQLPVVLSLVVALGGSPVLHASAPATSDAPNVAEQLLLSQANQDRVAHGLQPLERDPLLSQAAAFHAIQMARHGDISHGFPGEPELSERGAKAGVRFSLITENVAEAGNADVIHGLWMHSAGHRANLLDPEVNVVGVAVVVSQREVYAVEDFASTVEPMSFDDQELTVARLLRSTGIAVSDESVKATQEARVTCGMETGFAGHRQPWFIMRYAAADLSKLPTQLTTHLHSGRYRQAVIGACPASDAGPFTSYNIAVLLYP